MALKKSLSEKQNIELLKDFVSLQKKKPKPPTKKDNYYNRLAVQLKMD